MTDLRQTSRAVRHCSKEYILINKINVMVIRNIEKANIKRRIQNYLRSHNFYHLKVHDFVHAHVLRKSVTENKRENDIKSVTRTHHQEFAWSFSVCLFNAYYPIYCQILQQSPHLYPNRSIIKPLTPTYFLYLSFKTPILLICCISHQKILLSFIYWLFSGLCSWSFYLCYMSQYM